MSNQPVFNIPNSPTANNAAANTAAGMMGGGGGGGFFDVFNTLFKTQTPTTMIQTPLPYTDQEKNTRLALLVIAGVLVLGMIGGLFYLLK